MLLKHPTEADSTLSAKQLKRKFAAIEDQPMEIKTLEGSVALPPLPAPGGHRDALEDGDSVV
eukprot:9499387-Pyramimonas_sp.AAC.2